MTIDTEKLRALLAAATPGPWRKWAQHESTRCVWKDTLPLGSTCIESTGTVFALGVAVAATPDDGPDAALIAAAVNALPELLDAVESSRLKAEMYERDWYEAKSEFGSAMAGMSARIRNAEQALATAEAERLTLARALLESAPAALDGDPDAYFERRDAANDLAARIVAEADAAKAYLCTRCGAHVPENVPCSSCPAETDAEVRR